jgi:cytokinin dehydrogenase
VNPDLFDAMRGGLAQCGIITRATLQLVRAPERVRRFQIPYQDLRSLAADQRRVLTEHRFHQLQGAITPDEALGWRYQLEGAIYYGRDASPDDKAVLASLSDKSGAAVVTDLTYHDDALAFGNLEALLRSKGLWLAPQPWLFTFLRGSNAEQVAGGILRGLTGEDVGPFGRITFYPMLTQAFGSPLVRLPDENIAFPFNVVRIGAGSDARKTKQTIAQNRALYERIHAEGGVQYPVGALPTSREDWKDHFGPQWPLLHEAKRRYDPDNLLTPGYNLF